MGICGSVKTKREEDLISIFWNSLKINNTKCSELINEIKNLSKNDSFKYLVLQEKKEDLWKLQRKYFSSSISSFNTIAITLFEEIVYNNMFTENEFMCFCFSLLILTNDFKLYDEKKTLEILNQFFRIFKFRKVLISDINNNLYLDILDVYYFTCFFVNLVSLKAVKEIAYISDNKSSFDGKLNFTFSHTFQNRLLAELISEIIKEAEIHDLDKRWVKLLGKFRQIESLARNDISSRVILQSYNNFSTNVTLVNSKQIKAEEFNTGIIANNKVYVSTKELPLKSDRTEKEGQDKLNHNANFSKEIFNSSKDQLWISTQLFNKHILNILKNNKLVRERLILLSKNSIVQKKF